MNHMTFSEAFTGNRRDNRIKLEIDKKSRDIAAQPTQLEQITETLAALNFPKEQLPQIAWQIQNLTRETKLVREKRRTSSVLPNWKAKNEATETAALAGELSHASEADIVEAVQVVTNITSDTHQESGRTFLFRDYSSKLSRAAIMLVVVALTTVGLLGTFSRAASAANQEPGQSTNVVPAPREDKDSDIAAKNSEFPAATTGAGRGPDSDIQSGETITNTERLTETLELRYQPVSVTARITGTLFSRAGQKLGSFAPGRTITGTGVIGIEENQLRVMLPDGSYISLPTNELNAPMDAVTINNLDKLPGFVIDSTEVRDKHEKEALTVTTNSPLNLRNAAEIGDNKITGSDGKPIAVQGTFTATQILQLPNGDVWAEISDPQSKKTGFIAIKIGESQLAKTNQEVGAGGPIGIDWPVILVKLKNALQALAPNFGELSFLFKPPTEIDKLLTKPGEEVVSSEPPIAIIVGHSVDGTLPQVLATVAVNSDGKIEVTPISATPEVVDAIRDALQEAVQEQERTTTNQFVEELEGGIINDISVFPDVRIEINSNGDKIAIQNSLGTDVVVGMWDIKENLWRSNTLSDEEIRKIITENPVMMTPIDRTGRGVDSDIITPSALAVTPAFEVVPQGGDRNLVLYGVPTNNLIIKRLPIVNTETGKKTGWSQRSTTLNLAVLDASGQVSRFEMFVSAALENPAGEVFWSQQGTAIFTEDMIMKSTLTDNFNLGDVGINAISPSPARDWVNIEGERVVVNLQYAVRDQSAKKKISDALLSVGLGNLDFGSMSTDLEISNRQAQLILVALANNSLGFYSLDGYTKLDEDYLRNILLQKNLDKITIGGTAAVYLLND